MEDRIKILEEQKNCYIAEIGGKKVKLIKIDIDKLKSKHKNDLYLASTYLTNSDIKEILILLKRVIKNVPTVNEYETVAKALASMMLPLYNKLRHFKLSHLFHHYIKDVNPDTYGKAQTLMKQVNLINEDLQKINQYMNE